MERRMGSGGFKMKNVELRIISSSLSCHPEDTSEGSSKLLHCADSSLSLGMTLSGVQL